ncbi:NYN domain-containing protein [Ottowia sp.]|uniref:NYN domain-containing protein n=1 Tax=Ottowia sp. TaxID=1898956 RepID=UPI003A8B51EE
MTQMHAAQAHAAQAHAAFNTGRGALLIDADNFHDPGQLRAIHGQFSQHAGKHPICHVHGAAKLLYSDGLKSVWLELGAQLIPCLPLNKNTTDAALVVDAMRLHFQSGVRRFGIASGDADFAPLSLVLRELGCEVTCFARLSIAFEAMVPFYDRVVRFDALPAPPVPPPVATPQPAATAKMAVQPSPAQPSSTGAVKPAAQVPAPVAPKAKPVPQITAAEREAVRKILATLPKWNPHTVRQLNQLGTPLRDGGVKTGSAPLHQLFRKYPAFFTVLPVSGQAKQVRLERLP